VTPATVMSACLPPHGTRMPEPGFATFVLPAGLPDRRGKQTDLWGVKPRFDCGTSRKPSDRRPYSDSKSVVGGREGNLTYDFLLRMLCASVASLVYGAALCCVRCWGSPRLDGLGSLALRCGGANFYDLACSVLRYGGTNLQDLAYSALRYGGTNLYQLASSALCGGSTSLVCAGFVMGLVFLRKSRCGGLLTTTAASHPTVGGLSRTIWGWLWCRAKSLVRVAFFTTPLCLLHVAFFTMPLLLLRVGCKTFVWLLWVAFTAPLWLLWMALTALRLLGVVFATPPWLLCMVFSTLRQWALTLRRRYDEGTVLSQEVRCWTSDGGVECRTTSTKRKERNGEIRQSKLEEHKTADGWRRVLLFLEWHQPPPSSASCWRGIFVRIAVTGVVVFAACVVALPLKVGELASAALLDAGSASLVGSCGVAFVVIAVVVGGFLVARQQHPTVMAGRVFKVGRHRCVVEGGSRGEKPQGMTWTAWKRMLRKERAALQQIADKEECLDEADVVQIARKFVSGNVRAVNPLFMPEEGFMLHKQLVVQGTGQGGRMLKQSWVFRGMRLVMPSGDSLENGCVGGSRGCSVPEVAGGGVRMGTSRVAPGERQRDQQAEDMQRKTADEGQAVIREAPNAKGSAVKRRVVVDGRRLANPGACHEGTNPNTVQEGGFCGHHGSKEGSTFSVPMLHGGGRSGDGVDPRDPEGHIAFEFNVLDKNGDGFLSEDELFDGLCGRGWDQDELQDLFSNLDTNRDGRVSLEEYLNGMSKQSGGQLLSQATHDQGREPERSAADKAEVEADSNESAKAQPTGYAEQGGSDAHGAGGKAQVGMLSAFQATKGIKFLPFQKVLDFGRIPRSSEGLTVQAAELEDDTFKIFVSHRWLSPWWPGAPFPPPGLAHTRDGKDEGHPDRTGHPKYELLVAALRRMQADGWIPKDDDKVALWIDFACIDQDGENPADELNESMIRLVGLCDMVMTPVVDDKWPEGDWAGVKSRSDIVGAPGGAAVGYKAEAWKEYWVRAWCLLEMLYAANVPFSHELLQQRGFGGNLLQFVLDERVRPHALFGTRERKLKEAPLLLPPLRGDALAKNDPRQGQLTNENDRSTIERHVRELLITGLVRMGEIPRAVEKYGHEHVTDVLEKLAGVHGEQCEFSHQADLLLEALQIRRRELGDDHVDVARTYGNMGIVLCQQGDNKKGLEYFQKSLEIEVKVLGHDHVDVAATYCNMAIVYYSLGEYKKALEYYQKDLEISRKHLGDDHVHVATTQYNMANVHVIMMNTEEARRLFWRCAEVYEQVYGAQHSNTVNAQIKACVVSPFGLVVVVVLALIIVVSLYFIIIVTYSLLSWFGGRVCSWARLGVDWPAEL